MEEYVQLYLRDKVSKESGIQNLLTDTVIRQKVKFLTRFDTYFTYLNEYYVLIGGSTKNTYLNGH